MSDRLAIAATASVLMMSIYVLFGADAARVPLTAGELSAPAIDLPSPQVSLGAGDILPLSR